MMRSLTGAPVIRPLVPLLIALSILGAATSDARTARQLGSRIQIDGFTVSSGPTDTTEWREDEKVMGLNPATNDAEESIFDSRWGADNDVSQIRLTWDRDTLYVGVDAVIWGNNVLVWLDIQPATGMFSMFGLNSWRRGFAFSGSFTPDLMGATWDGNLSPHLVLSHPTPGNFNNVDDLQAGNGFRAAATFSGNLRNRAMEFAIPWNTVMLGPSGGIGSPKVAVAPGDSVSILPTGAVLRIAAAVTGGADGTGGPDSAPDKTGCHVSDGNQPVTIDNFAIIPLDLNDDTGFGDGGPDGVADWGIAPSERVTFRFQPPIRCKPLESEKLEVDRPAFAPDRGEQASFKFDFKLRLDPNDPADQLRSVRVSATVHNLRGEKVRDLYFLDERPALDQRDPCITGGRLVCSDVWDGRDNVGRLVPPGVYVLRLILLEPFNSRLTRPIVVAR